MLRALVFVVAQAVVVTELKCGYHDTWVNLQRTIHEQGYNDVEISTYRTYDELVLAMDRVVWTGDGLSRGFESVSVPGRVEDIIQKDGKRPDVDCDDFAVYEVAALNRSVERGVFTGDLVQASMLSVIWQWKTDGITGHAVALLERNIEGRRMFSYMDYGGPSEPRDSLDKVVQDVVRDYNGARPVVAYTQDVDPKNYGLRLVEMRVY